MEVISTFAQIYIMMVALEWIVLIFVRAFTVDAVTANAQPVDSGVNYLDTKCPAFEFEKFRGGSYELLAIQLVLFLMNIFSMFLLMIKSRCKKVGTDIGSQFEPTYMRLLATRISGQIDLNVPYAQKYYEKKERMVSMAGVIELKVNMQRNAFVALESKKPIKDEEAAEWIKTNVVGRITKADLDGERLRETNALDMH